MDTLALYRTFLQVAEKRSFTAAALALGQPRSTVSGAIQALETRLGVLLFHRTTRRVTPTPDGEALRTRCRAVLDDLDDLEASFRDETAWAKGRLRIDAPTRIGHRVLLPALPEFLALHPGIQIALSASDRTVDLVEDRVDCAIRVGAITATPGLALKPLGRLPVLNLASPAYLTRFGEPQGPDDLDRHLTVRYAATKGAGPELWEWREGGRILTCEVPSRLTVDSAEALIAAGIAGIGLVQAPAYDVADEIAAGRLVEVMPKHRADPLPIMLLIQDRPAPSRRLSLLIDWLSALLPEKTRYPSSTLAVPFRHGAGNA